MTFELLHLGNDAKLWVNTSSKTSRKYLTVRKVLDDTVKQLELQDYSTDPYPGHSETSSHLCEGSQMLPLPVFLSSLFLSISWLNWLISLGANLFQWNDPSQSLLKS